jgi:hypothetical protein
MKARTVSFCLLVCLARFPMQAQSTFGAIVGNVKDKTDSMVGAATVKITNTGENATVQVVSATNGNYEALNLKPGTYTVTISHPGFQMKSFNDVQLLARQTVRVDAVLEVGAVEQAVNYSYSSLRTSEMCVPTPTRVKRAFSSSNQPTLACQRYDIGIGHRCSQYHRPHG